MSPSEFISQGHNSMQTIKMVSGKVHQTKFGAFPHDDFIGKEFGSKVNLRFKSVIINNLQ